MRDFSRKTVIVTGGAGFIGSNIVKRLNGAGVSDVVIVDHLGQSGKWKNLIPLSFSEYYDKRDFIELIKHDSLPLRPAAVIHMGACSDTTMKDVDYLMTNNTQYSWELFTYCTRHSIPFLYASSGATYGMGEDGFRDTTVDLRPLNAYGYSKYLFDRWVLAATRRPPQWVGFKFFNIYGPCEYHKGFMASMVFHGYLQIKSKGAMRLFKSYRQEYGDGEQLRDFMYIDDAIDVIMHFLHHSELSGIVNVGTGRARSFNDLASATFNTLGRKHQIEYFDMPPGLREKYQYRTEANVSTLRTLGYTRESRSLEEGVREYITSYLSKESFDS